MPADRISPVPLGLSKQRRRAGQAWAVAAGLAMLFALSSAPAAWAGATNTVPRETPTRSVTAITSATVTIAPTLAPTSVASATATRSATLAPTVPASQTTATASATPAKPTTTPISVSPTSLAAASATIAQTTATPAASPATMAPTPQVTILSQTPIVPALASPSMPSTVVRTATSEPGGGACAGSPATPLALSSPDGRAALDVPAGSLAAGVCVQLDIVDLAALPVAPAGFRLVGPAARIRMTDTAGREVTGASFAAPANLSLRPLAIDAQTGVVLLEIGVLGTTSADWAILEAERDSQSGALTTHVRQAGVYSLLARVAAPAAAEPTTGAAASLPEIVLGLAAILGVALALLLAWRRRSAARGSTPRR